MFRLPEVKTCSLKQNNVVSFVVLDRLYKYTDMLPRCTEPQTSNLNKNVSCIITVTRSESRAGLYTHPKTTAVRCEVREFSEHLFLLLVQTLVVVNLQTSKPFSITPWKTKHAMTYTEI
jgi:hypothetical protein